jgi:hypothetical protein
MKSPTSEESRGQSLTLALIKDTIETLKPRGFTHLAAVQKNKQELNSTPWFFALEASSKPCRSYTLQM